MAGQPRRRAMLAALEDRTRATFEDAAHEPREQASHLDYVCYRLAGGQTMTALAAEIRQAARWADTDLSPGMITHYLRSTFDDARERMAEARASGADMIAESSVDVSDEAVDSKEDAARQRNRIGARQWLAMAFAPRLRANSGTAVQVNIGAGTLMLEALRARASHPVIENGSHPAAATARATLASPAALVAEAQPVAVLDVADLL